MADVVDGLFVEAVAVALENFVIDHNASDEALNVFEAVADVGVAGVDVEGYSE